MVLRSHPLGESDRIVTFPDAFGGQGPRRGEGGAPEPPALRQQPRAAQHVRLSDFEREGSELGASRRPTWWSRSTACRRIPNGRRCWCLAEVADAFSREQQRTRPTFRLLHAVLGAIRDGLDLDRRRATSRSGRSGCMECCRPCPPARAAGATSRGAADLTIAGGRRALPPLCSEPRAGKRAAAGPGPGGCLPDPEEAPGSGGAAGRGRAGGPRSAGGIGRALFFDLTEKRFKSYEVLRALRAGP